MLEERMIGKRKLRCRGKRKKKKENKKRRKRRRTEDIDVCGMENE